LIVLCVLASQSQAVGWRMFIEGVLHFVPLLGRARRSLAIARLSSALEALISAGTDVVSAWDLAAAASASPALQQVVRNARPQLVAGTAPSEFVRASSHFPEVFANMYQTGEISGKLDESLDRARVYFQEEGSRKLKQFMICCVAILFGSVMLLVAWEVIHFYIGYFQQINDVTEGF
jgi:type II secretory pathway component PulF